jgi:hypothetical protein
MRRLLPGLHQRERAVPEDEVRRLAQPHHQWTPRPAS